MGEHDARIDVEIAALFIGEPLDRRERREALKSEFAAEAGAKLVVAREIARPVPDAPVVRVSAFSGKFVVGEVAWARARRTRPPYRIRCVLFNRFGQYRVPGDPVVAVLARLSHGGDAFVVAAPEEN